MNDSIISELYIILETRKKKIEDLEDRLAIAKEALQFYAGTENWLEINHTDLRIAADGCDISMECDLDYSKDPFACGGKKAREALEKIK